MIRIGKVPKEPFWLNLLYGVRWKVRPFTTALSETARARADAQVAELQGQLASIQEVGGEVVGLPDLADPFSLEGVQRQCFFQALAVQALVAWENILDEETGEPAPVTEENIAFVANHIPYLVQDFVAKYSAPYNRLIAEGNGLPAAVIGTSSPTAAGTTAATATASTSPAPGESPEKTATAAPT